jgi:hypothetical protein
VVGFPNPVTAGHYSAASGQSYVTSGGNAIFSGAGNWSSNPTGAIGATGPTFSAQTSTGPPIDIRELYPVMRQHRRLYINEMDRLSVQPNLLMSLIRNRIILIVQQDEFRYNADNLIEQYVAWLDDHNDGLYTVEKSFSSASLVVSFELEADMIQFTLAFR